MSTASISSPAPASTNSPRSSMRSTVSVQDPLDAFFGTSNATRESRHDEARPVSEALPAYTESAEPPAYKEPSTLAMYLFKFGFLFFPFWIIGSCILLSSLRTPPPSTASPMWMPEKTEEERQHIIELMRNTEVKWAKRCIYALLALFFVVLVVVIAAWAIKRA